MTATLLPTVRVELIKAALPDESAAACAARAAGTSIKAQKNPPNSLEILMLCLLNRIHAHVKTNFAASEGRSCILPRSIAASGHDQPAVMVLLQNNLIFFTAATPGLVCFGGGQQ